MNKSNLKKATFAGEEKPFYLPDLDKGERGKREAPGVSLKYRMWRNGEAYGYLDPDELASLAEPPEHAQVALEDTFGEWATDEDGNERIKLRVHPHMHRWALYEREYSPAKGANVWRCFYIFQTDPKPGHLPQDLDGDIYKAHFRGKVGDYVEPDRSHFELLEKFNIKKYGYNAVNEHAGALEDKEYQACEAAEQEHAEAFLDEHWSLARDEANQAAGSGHYMHSGHCDTWHHKADLSRYRRIDKGSYTLIEKKTREEYDRELKEELERFTNIWAEMRGLRKNWNPTKADLEEALIKAGLLAPGEKREIKESKKIIARQFEKDMSEHFFDTEDEEAKERKEALRRIKAAGYNLREQGTT